VLAQVANGHFNYVNHITGLHINGPVDSVVVTATNPNDPSGARTVRFCGNCGPGANVDSCRFVVTVEDHGEPGTNDVFCLNVTGVGAGLPETQCPPTIARGNIQFHPTH
jgi:hypothetical protein